MDTQTPDQYRAQRLANRAKLAELGYAPYGRAFARTGTLKETRDTFEEGKTLAIAGRIQTKRRMGKLMFIHLNDGTDAFQILLKRDGVGEDAYNAAKLLDLGDIIGVKGTLFTTQAGEKTVDVATWELLSKAVRQPPEKWHGLQDQEERYRRRYLDLMSNPESRARFDKRHKILLGIRNYLTSKGFVEVETPIMQAQAGGAAAKPFVTHHNALDREMVLRIAPELYLKRLLVGGFDKIFELGKDFRNEGIDRTHNPEFTVLEVYEAYGDRTSMKRLIEGLLPHLCDTVLGTRQIPYGTEGKTLNFEPPYREISQRALIEERMGPDWFTLDYDTARARAAQAGLELTPEIVDHLTLSHEVYDKLIEKTLFQPTFVTRIPKQYVPLAPHPEAIRPPRQNLPGRPRPRRRLRIRRRRQRTLPRLHRAKRPRRPTRSLHPPSRSRRRTHRPRLRRSPRIRHAPHRRPRPRHRPPRHAPHQHRSHPRRHPLPPTVWGLLF